MLYLHAESQQPVSMPLSSFFQASTALLGRYSRSVATITSSFTGARRTLPVQPMQQRVRTAGKQRTAQLSRGAVLAFVAHRQDRGKHRPEHFAGLCQEILLPVYTTTKEACQKHTDAITHGPRVQSCSVYPLDL